MIRVRVRVFLQNTGTNFLQAAQICGLAVCSIQGDLHLEVITLYSVIMQFKGQSFALCIACSVMYTGCF